MAEPLIDVKDLKKYFHLGKNQLLKAVDGVSFAIPQGQTLGLVGESGCGKSTVGRTLLRLYPADGGQVLYHGKNILKTGRRENLPLSKSMQMIFQDPYASLDPRKTVGAIIGEGLEIHHLHTGREERPQRIYQLLEMVGLNREHANRFPHEFSGGQRQRVGIARALSVNPEFIVCDEAISALDVSIQAQIINLLMELQQQLGLTYLFIAHDLNMVRYISDQIAVMYLGSMMELADAETLFLRPLHPYTMGLLASSPTPDPRHEKERPAAVMLGEVPSPINPPPGCKFNTRCPRATEICQSTAPALAQLEPGHYAACHHPGGSPEKEPTP